MYPFRNCLVNLTILYFLCLKSSNGFSVGIVGGGIGGTATAYYLQKLFKGDINVTLFEAHKIGGRLSTRAIGKHHYEVGGAVALTRNIYIHELVEELGLKKRAQTNSGYSCLYDGEKVVFAESWWHVLTVAQSFLRYGLNIYYLNRHISKRLDLFDRIYELQGNANGYANVTSLLHAMDETFVGDTTLKTDKGFEQEGLSGPVVDELVAGTIRVNYGQYLNVHKFVGAVSVAGAGNDFFAVEGGNWKVAQRLLEESHSTVVQRPVTHVTKLPSGLIEVTLPGRSDIPPENEHPLQFDAVVVASPQTADMKNRISFRGFPDEIAFNGMYHRTVTTLLRGKLRIEKFAGAHPYTDEIITTRPVGVFNSISRVYPVSTEEPVNSTEHVWKIFSQRVLTSEEIADYFHDVSDITVDDWLAYPEYGTEKRDDRFELSPGLYHLNAIEWAASAMEMSLISAKNIAVLIRNSWCLQHGCPNEVNGVKERSDL